MTLRILVVDDDPSMRKVLGQLLLLEGYVVDSCSDAIAALVCLRSHAYDVLLTDYVMPGMSGLALVRAAREAHGALRCIVISGLGPPLDQELNEVVAWLCKPLDFDDLLRWVRG